MSRRATKVPIVVGDVAEMSDEEEATVGVRRLHKRNIKVIHCGFYLINLNHSVSIFTTLKATRSSYICHKYFS